MLIQTQWTVYSDAQIYNWINMFQAQPIQIQVSIVVFLTKRQKFTLVWMKTNSFEIDQEDTLSLSFWIFVDWGNRKQFKIIAIEKIFRISYWVSNIVNKNDKEKWTPHATLRNSWRYQYFTWKTSVNVN